MNKLLGIGFLGLLGYGLYKLFGLKQISEKVITSLSRPRLHKVDLRGIVLRTEINIENPTNFSATITKPVITLTSNNRYITSTKPEQKEIVIKPLGSSVIDTIEIVIPWTSIAGYATNIISKIPQLTQAWKDKNLKAFADTLAIPLEMKYSLYANGLFYQSTPEKLL